VKYIEEQRYNATSSDRLKLDEPFLVDNKIDVNGTMMGGSQDGRTFSFLDIDERIATPVAGTKGRFEVESAARMLLAR